MKRKFIDTNVFLRYLTADDRAKYNRCRDLIKSAVEGKVQLVTSGMVIAELMWTMQSYYKLPKTEIIEKVSLIISTDEIEIPECTILAEAMVLYSLKNIDFIDAYNASFMRHYGASEIYSYDKDFDTIDGLHREEP